MKKSNRSIFFISFLAIIIFIAMGLRLSDFLNERTVTIKIAGIGYEFVVPTSEKMRIRGLSYRDSMGPYEGMYFIFDRVGINRMVMREMRFPLDMVWLNGSTITDLAENLAPEPGRPEKELTIYSNKTPGTGVMELPAGFIKKYGLKVGDKVEIGSIR